MALVSASCGGDSDAPVIHSAASLTDVVPALVEAFDASAGDSGFRLNLGGSSTLALQINDGAPGGVFLAADQATMDLVVEAGNAGDPVVFAHNRLVLVRRPGADVEALADLARPELLVGLCAPSVPCGALARVELASRSIEPALDTEEPDVRSLLAKVAAGELDAALVYATDALASADVEVVATDLAATTPYLAAVVGEDPSPSSAAFVAFLGSVEAREILAEAGFGPP